MQIRPEQLDAALKRALCPIYLISGEETLRVNEACDSVVAAAREQGFSERSVHHVESGFSWHDLSHDAASLSLFAERKILDLRISATRFDKQASEALRAWTRGDSGNADVILLIRTERLQARQRSSAWFKAIEKVGAVVLIWPLSGEGMHQWLAERLARRSLELTPDALAYLGERVEGNLLAAVQEVEKLALQDLEQPIELSALQQFLEDTSRFSSFDLIDAAMAGQSARSSHMLRSLRDEGVSVFAILGALTRRLRRLGQTQGLPPARARTLEAFARRVPSALSLLAECALIDEQGKGERLGDPWVSLEQLMLFMAETPGQRPPSRYQRALRGY